MKKIIFTCLVALVCLGSYFESRAMRGISICPGSAYTCSAVYEGIEVFSEKCWDCGSIEIRELE